MKKRAVIYARVSSKEQEKEGYSIAAQLKSLYEYAERHDIEVVQEFVDAETAKKVGRTNFKEMINLIKKKKGGIQALLVEKTDRLTRNFHDYVAIDEILQNYDVEVHLVKESGVLTKNSRSNQKIMFGFQVLLANNFINNLAEETSKGMMEKAAQGHWPSRAPYGYRNNQQTRLIEEHPEQSRYVKRAFALYATGDYSIKRLIDTLYQEGYRFRPSSPKPSTSNMHQILTSQFYTGHFVFRGLHRIGQHPPLVTAQLFRQVQRRLKQANKPDYERRKIAFANLITCGHCGCAVTGDIKQKGRYVYYRCTHYKKKCPDKYIREERLQEQFLEIIRAFSITEEQYHWMVEGLKALNVTHDTELKERKQDIDKQIQLVNNRLSQMYVDKLDGEIDGPTYKRLSAEYQERLITLQSQLERLRNASKNNRDLGMAILEFARDAYTVFSRHDAYNQSKILSVLFSKCELKDGNLTVTYKRPFDLIAERPKDEKWYPQGNSNPCLLRERELS